MEWRIEVDLDGVLADFDKRFIQITGTTFIESGLDSKQKWELLKEKDPNIYRHLEPMPDALELWDAIKHKNPSILTAIPSTVPFINSPRDKREWVHKHIQEGVLVKFGPYAVDKQYHCTGRHHVLIDDRPQNCEQWAKKGGISILHGRAAETIKTLQILGVI